MTCIQPSANSTPVAAPEPVDPSDGDVQRLLEQALQEVRDGVDATATISHALHAHGVLLGEATTEDPEDGISEERPCICPPDLVERGGFRSGCLRHAGGESW